MTCRTVVQDSWRWLNVHRWIHSARYGWNENMYTVLFIKIAGLWLIQPSPGKMTCDVIRSDGKLKCENDLLTYVSMKLSSLIRASLANGLCYILGIFLKPFIHWDGESRYGLTGFQCLKPPLRRMSCRKRFRGEDLAPCFGGVRNVSFCPSAASWGNEICVHAWIGKYRWAMQLQSVPTSPTWLIQAWL